jgi:tRNA(adenine34) deaminase
MSAIRTTGRTTPSRTARFGLAASIALDQVGQTAGVIAEDGAMSEEKAGKKRWVRGVKSVSTYPPEGLFTRDAETIARTMASEKVSPKGIGSGIRMVQYFINRAGKSLPAERKAELEKAKRILQAKAREEDHRDGSDR